MTEAHNTALVRRAVVEIWNRGKLELADVLFAAEYVNHAGLIPDLVRGPEAIKISVAFYRTAFPSFYITMDELTAKKMWLCCAGARAAAQRCLAVPLAQRRAR